MKDGVFSLWNGQHAFQRDPEFFQFWRTMQAWREAFADGDARLLLSPDSDFFRYFRTIPQPGAGPSRPAAAPAAAAPASPAPAAGSSTESPYPGLKTPAPHRMSPTPH